MTLVHLVGADAATTQLVAGVVRDNFPQATLGRYSRAEEIPVPETNGPELLVLDGAATAEAAGLEGQLDAHGLPRWAVVSLRQEEGEAEDWPDARCLSQIFQAACREHRLRRENARLRGDLLTMALRISHDLRTPLNGILSTGEIIREVLHEKDPSGVALTGAIFSSVDEMVKLMSRTSFVLKASALRTSPRTVPMGNAAWAAIQRLEKTILVRKAQVVQPDQWPEVAGVEPWLEVIWGNLLANALEHGGATRIELGWEPSPGGHTFWVLDNGKGVNPARQKHLFRPFHALHVSGAGHGVGLSLVQRLVELQGGQVAYAAVPEGGSRFSFTLPA